MIRKSLPFVTGAAMVVVLVQPAFAASVEDGPDASNRPPAPIEPDDVAMTAGVGVTNLSGFGSLPPLLTAGVEGRLLDHLWLAGRAHGQYAEGPGYDTWTAGGALGPRIVFNPRDRVQASTFLLLGASYSSLQSEDEYGTFSAETLAADGEAGLTVDIGIIAGVGLRLSSPLLRVSRFFVSDSNPSTGIDIGPRPEIQLRVSF